MKVKKKPSRTVKKTTKKTIPAKPFILIDKTAVTTKQKAHTTLQDHLQIGEPRKQIRSNKNVTLRNNCSRKMEQHNLSPFSSHEQSSASPKHSKKVNPYVKDHKEKKKGKGKPELRIQKYLQKRQNQASKVEVQAKRNIPKEKTHQYEYQNFFIRRLDEKKITQMSEQSSASILKKAKVQTGFATSEQGSANKSKITILNKLKDRILHKHKRQFPGLRNKELKFLCCIVLIQRLWRQHRIKSLINDYISPRVYIDHKASDGFHRQASIFKLDSMVTTQQHTLELIKKYHHFNVPDDKKLTIEEEVYSTEMGKAKKQKKLFNLEQLELSSEELTPQKQAKMIKFVERLRDVSFHKPNKGQIKSQINFFNLESSKSEDCLLQKFYAKVFKKIPRQTNNLDLFNLKKEENHLQKSIEMINAMKTPEKVKNIEIQIQERFQTELHEYEPFQQQSVTKAKKIQASVETEYQEQQQINLTRKRADQIISLLLNQFCKQYSSFQNKTVLRRQRRAHLPGLHISQSTMREYLDGLSHFMLQNHGEGIIRRFCLNNATSILKIQHDQIYLSEQEEEECNLPIIPNEVFYDYQIIYQQNVFVIGQEDRAFTNFLQSLIKISNLLLRDCLSEMLQKKKIDRIVLPWDHGLDQQRSKQKYGRLQFQKDLNKIISHICQFAFTRLGKFHSRLHDPIEQTKMLTSITQDLQNEDNQWRAQFQYFQTRMELASIVKEQILDEFVLEIMRFL